MILKITRLRIGIQNITNPTLKIRSSGPSLLKLLNLEIVDDVNKNRVLNDNSLRSRFSLAGKDCKNVNTMEMSKVFTYLGRGGLNRNTALTACETKG